MSVFNGFAALDKRSSYLRVALLFGVLTACQEPKTPYVPEAAQTSTFETPTTAPQLTPELVRPGPSPFQVPAVVPGNPTWARSCQDLLPLAQDRIWNRLVRERVYDPSTRSTQSRGAPVPPPFRTFVPVRRGDDKSQSLVANDAFVGLIEQNKLWVWDRTQKTLHALKLDTEDPAHQTQAIALEGTTLWLLASTTSHEILPERRPQNWQANRHARGLTKVQEWSLGTDAKPQKIATTYLPGSAMQFITDAQGAHVALRHPFGQIDEQLASDFVPSPAPKDLNPAVRQAIASNQTLIEGLRPEALLPFYYQEHQESRPSQGALLDCQAIARLAGNREEALLKVQVPPTNTKAPDASFGLIDATDFRHLDQGWFVLETPKDPSQSSLSNGFFIQSPQQTKNLQIHHSSHASPGLALHQNDIYVIDAYARPIPEPGAPSVKKLTWLQQDQSDVQIRDSLQLPESTYMNEAFLSPHGLLSTNHQTTPSPLDRVQKTGKHTLAAMAPLHLVNLPEWSYRPLGDDAILGTGFVGTPEGTKRGLSVHKWLQASIPDPKPSYLLPSTGVLLNRVSLKSAVYLHDRSTLVLPYYSNKLSEPGTLKYGVWLISLDAQGMVQSARNLALPSVTPPPRPQHIPVDRFDRDPTRAGVQLGSQVLFQLHDRLLWIDPVEGKLIREVPLSG